MIRKRADQGRLRLGLFAATLLAVSVPAWAGNLTGKVVCIGPSHGYYDSSTGWRYQRGPWCDLGEEVQEDLNSVRICRYLDYFLQRDGADVRSVRALYEDQGTDSETGLAWWRMASYHWLKDGISPAVPSTVWDYAGNVDDDDINCRPRYADYVDADLYLSVHTNGTTNHNASGTETYYTSQMDHSGHAANSQSLADALHRSVIFTIDDHYDGDWYTPSPAEPDGPPAADAGLRYGEIRIPDRPAALVEVAFHDYCAKDSTYLADPVFRSLTGWAMYNGICQYLGVAAEDRLPLLDAELIEADVPAIMVPGQSYNATVQVRNRGMAWSAEQGVKFGIHPDDPDPLGCGQVALPPDTVIEPDQTFTFTFTLIAPSTPGSYTFNPGMLHAPTTALTTVTRFEPRLNLSIPVQVTTTGWITDWAVVGPFNANALGDYLYGNCAFTERNLDPSVGNRLGGYSSFRTWTRLQAAPIGNALGLDFRQFSTQSNANVYAHTYLYCPSTRTVRSRLGCYEGFELYIDGTQIHRADGPANGNHDQYLSSPFTLTKGWHRVMAQVRHGTSNWRLFLRFDDGNGNIQNDLSFTPYRSQIGAGNGLLVPDDVLARPSCIRDWLVLGAPRQTLAGGLTSCGFYGGPYRDNLAYAGGGPESAVRPEAGQVQVGLTWTDTRDSNLIVFHGAAQMLNFDYYHGVDYGEKTAYLHTYCYNPGSPKLARFSLAADDAARIYVNGNVILHRCGAGRACDADISPIFTLPSGPNSILLRIDESPGLWNGVLKLIESNTLNPLAGVMFSTNPTAPTVVQNPVSQVTGFLQTIVLNAQASGINLLFQWQKNGQNLLDSILPNGPGALAGQADGPLYSGVTTPTLTIQNADLSAAGLYRCVITNVSGDTVTEEAQVSIALKADGFASLRTHDAGGVKGIGPIDLPIPLSMEQPTTEPRLGGIQTLVAYFTEPAEIPGGQVSAADISISDGQSSYTPASVSLQGDTLVMNFGPGTLPDVGSYTVDLIGAFRGLESGMELAGDTTCVVRGVEADTNNDGRVNLIDLAQTKASYGRYANEAGKTGLDLNLDGVINLIDLVACRARYGNQLP